ncbi:nuclear receptor ROR-gamma isoform X2 [Eurytemora carolleeae]|uniref:nuclear receptor ROR-gamma isoform X2 n=1 Tax=Eurytemora carolleeae TaxID=1294199 RepID=UPI000C76961F|nr:nuclear receptor ROR-gamma isoform X2 [Eurytemora carolleeae]|eukprot:XP_023337649.1 nuclear receptor ROR-gamma-like isoform X2 [Eurytemora affinis]
MNNTNFIQVSVIKKVADSGQKVGRQQAVAQVDPPQGVAQADLQQAAAQRPQKKETSLTSSCTVCGDKATKYRYSNYGTTSCFSCRAFFRRTISKGNQELFYCGEGNCEVNLNTRKKCQYCRFNKCIAVGMTYKEQEKKDVAPQGSTDVPSSSSSSSNSLVAGSKHDNRFTSTHDSMKAVKDDLWESSSEEFISSAVQIPLSGKSYPSEFHGYTQSSCQDLFESTLVLDQGQDASSRSVDPCNSRQLVSSTTYTVENQIFFDRKNQKFEAIASEENYSVSQHRFGEPEKIASLCTNILDIEARFNSDDQQRIDQLVNIDKSTQLTIEDIPKEILETLIKLMFSADGGKSLDYAVIIWGYTFAIQKITYFAKSLPEFVSCSIEDQKNLLYQNSDPIFNIKSAMFFNSGSDSFTDQMNKFCVFNFEKLSDKFNTVVMQPIEWNQLFKSPWATNLEHEQKYVNILNNTKLNPSYLCSA